MKSIVLSAFAFLFLFSAKSNAAITDTIHVSHYDITMDSMNYTSHYIYAVTEATVHSKVNGLNSISLSLKNLSVDSVSCNGSPLVYSYSDPVLLITPPSVLNQNDSVVIRIRYHGLPWTDASFGGFYFSGTYAFNLGVCTSTDPHSAGKAWFPCVDEFLEHSTYDFHITSPSGYKAFCNGILQSSINNPNGTVTWNWKMNQPISTYLAAVAVAPFYTINRTYQGVPVQIAVLPGDSVKTLSTFQHLDSVLMSYITAYGAYPFDKVGYVCVPFNYGAMEHASSIHIGKPFIDGSLTYESLWAHELSHMWWGDKVTCEKEEEMWLNEGWATYHENAYRESLYGKQAYLNAARALHHKVVQFCHVFDNGYYPLNNIPPAYSYNNGNTVYNKGGDVVHSLRQFMGDSAFFKACKYHLSQRAYGNSNSAQLRDDFAASSGINLTDYFNTIVFTPGFPHVSLDSFVVTPNGGNYDVAIYTREKQKGNTQTFTLPVEFTFSDASKDTSISFTVNAPSNSFTTTLPFIPQWVSVDRYGKLSDAIVDYEYQISAPGSYTFTETNASINVLNAGSGSSVIRIEHNYVRPDTFRIPHAGVRISDYHYYKVDGMMSNGFLASGTFVYNGTTSSSFGYLDNTLILGNTREDSLLIFYRANSGEDWQLVNGFVINFNNSHIDKSGSITVDTLKRGEYVFGIRDYTVVGINEPLSNTVSDFKVYPNPVADVCHISFHLYSPNGVIQVTDELGRTVYSTEVFSHQETIDWDTFKMKQGIYFVQLMIGNKVIGEEKVMVEKK